MCLYIDTTKHPDNKRRIAQCDILVWKSGNWDVSGRLRPTYRYGFRYQAGVKTIPVPLRVRSSWGVKQVHAGYHSYCQWNTRYPAIIPKGAKFFFGSRGDIVSSSLIVYKTLKAALKGRTLLSSPMEHKLAK